MLKSATVASLLLGLPLIGFGQASDPTPRYYVGLAVLSSDLQPLQFDYRGVAVPVQLTLGYQLRPRLAAQLGLARTTTDRNYFGAGVSDYGPNGVGARTYFDVDYSIHSRAFTTAALLRYTLTRNAGHRFQADALGGLTYLRSDYEYNEHRTMYDSTQTVLATNSIEEHQHGNYLLLTAGLSARLRLGHHLEAVADGTLSYGLLHGDLGLNSGAALGLRYRFGGRR